MYNLSFVCGCSSVVERHVANVNVVGSNLITRSFGGVYIALLLKSRLRRIAESSAFQEPP